MLTNGNRTYNQSISKILMKSHRLGLRHIQTHTEKTAPSFI